MLEIPAPTLSGFLKEKYIWSICVNMNVNPFQRVYFSLINLKSKIAKNIAGTTI